MLGISLFRQHSSPVASARHPRSFNDLVPTRSEGRTRAIHRMHHASTYDEVLFGILARFDAVVEGRDRDRGRMMAARCLGTIGRLDEAIEILEGLVGDTYLRGTPFEFEVIVSYAVLLVWQRRGKLGFGASLLD